METHTVFRRLSDDELDRFRPFVTRWLRYIGAVIAGIIAIRMVMS